jgi:mycothiol synthase
VRLRPAAPEDAEAAAKLVIAVDIDEMGEPDYTVEDLRDEWNEPGFELGKDAIVVEDEHKAMIAYAHFRDGDVLAVVDPRRQGEGAGTLLLEWIERRGRERGDKTLRQGIGDRGASSRALLERHGYTVARRYYRLERDVGPGDEEPPGLRALTPEDAPSLYAIHEAAFAGRPDHTPRSEEVWTQREFGSHALDYEMSRVAEGKGFTLTRRFENDLAYVALLAVHPDHAGQGLGSRLLRATFAAAAKGGRTQVVLNVASDNPNALKLYERVGMTQRWRIDDYQKPLPD